MSLPLSFYSIDVHEASVYVSIGAKQLKISSLNSHKEFELGDTIITFSCFVQNAVDKEAVL